MVAPRAHVFFSINFLNSTTFLILGMGCHLLLDYLGVGEILTSLPVPLFTMESVYFQLLSLVALAGFLFVAFRSHAPMTSSAS